MGIEMPRKQGTNQTNQPTIEGPAPNRPPLKANIFAVARSSGGTLFPMFPYVEEGSIVPTTALVWGRPNGTYGQFIHENTEDEVAIIFGAAGAVERSGTGIVRVGNKTHPVGGFLKNEDDPDDFVLISITVRQSEGRTQREAVWFPCQACKKEIDRIDFDAKPPELDRQGKTDNLLPLETIIQSGAVAERFNKDEQSRTCRHCGHVNAPFPTERWGWATYTNQTKAATEARRAFSAAAEVHRQ